MFMYSYYNRRKGKSIAVYEKKCTKGRGQNFAFCAQFSRFCEKCKPEREYLHPFKLTEPERYSQRKSG